MIGLPSAVLAGAHEQQAVLASARVIGMTDEDAAEVVNAWVTWSSNTGFQVHWPTVRDSLARRAVGEEWHPDRLVVRP